MDVVSICKRIDEAVRMSGIPKMEFYDRVGITSSAYAHWKSGKNQPTGAVLSRMAEVLGVSFDWLVSGKEEKQEPKTETPFKEVSALLESLTDEELRYIRAKIDVIEFEREHK